MQRIVIWPLFSLFKCHIRSIFTETVEALAMWYIFARWVEYWDAISSLFSPCLANSNISLQILSSKCWY